jgi:3-oxoacyl-[acyl-carrier protein] reductase
VNAIAPGYFPSKMTKSITENEAMTKYALTKIPAGRMGTPEDIAGTALYLSSRASEFTFGQTIAIDGGQISTA